MEKTVSGIVDILKWLGAAALAGMMLLTTVDVILRAFGEPILGAVEIVGLLAIMVVAGSLPMTHVQRGHAYVDMLIRKLPPRIQGMIDCATSLISLGLFIVISYEMFVYGKGLQSSGEVSMTLELPTFWLVYFTALACTAMCPVFLWEMYKSCRKAAGR